MRADMLDTERLLGPVRVWFGRGTIGRAYQVVAPLLAARLGITLPNLKYRLLPDGQPYVDPQKDIRAAVDSIAGGLSNFESEISKRGGDYRKVWQQLKVEQEEAKALGLKIDLSATNAPPPQSSLGVVDEGAKGEMAKAQAEQGEGSEDDQQAVDE